MEQDSQVPQPSDGPANKGPGDKGLKNKALALVNQVTRERASELIQGFFDELSDELLEFSQAATDDHVYQYFYARAKLIRSREQLTNTFLYQLEQPLADFGSERFSDDTALKGDAEDLSLVDEESMEEGVIITATSQRARSRYRELLWKLDRQFGLLAGVDVDKLEQNPFAPEQFCLALRKVLHHVTDATMVKKATYKLFEQEVINHLDKLYQELNRGLSDLGFVPGKAYGVVKARDVAGGSGERGWNRIIDREQTAGRSGEEYKRQLLSGLRGESGQYPAESGRYTEADLNRALDKIQELEWQRSREVQLPVMGSGGVQPVDIAAVTEKLLHKLTQLLATGEDAQLHKVDMQTIDLVGMLFEYILNDKQLPDMVKAMLSHLHTPLLKLAFVDRSFFQQSEHPARVLLNRLAQAGTRWVKADGGSEYGVYERIQQCVEHLLKNGGNSVRPFTEELMSFNTFLKRLELKIEMMEKRATEEAKGEDLRNQVNRRVHRELSYRIGSRELPSAVLMFLLQPWTDYLCQLLLRSSEESDDWRQALDLVDDLLWGLQISGNADEKHRWRQHYPWIETKIRQGFEAIGYEEGSRRKMLSAINHVYKSQLQDQDLRPAPEAVRSRLIKLAERRAGVQAEGNRKLSGDEQQNLASLGDLPFGTWFEFDSGRREKLVWYNLRTQQFLFTDQAGHRSSMRTGQDIARLMTSGTMRIADAEDKPLVDRTLEQIQADLSAEQQVASG